MIQGSAMHGQILVRYTYFPGRIFLGCNHSFSFSESRQACFHEEAMSQERYETVKENWPAYFEAIDLDLLLLEQRL